MKIVDDIIENKDPKGKVLNYIARNFCGMYMLEGRGITVGEAIDNCLLGEYTISWHGEDDPKPFKRF